MLYAYFGACVLGVALLAASLFGAGHGQAGAHDGDGQAALALLSVRVWTYLLAFGGLTGLLLRVVAHAGEPTSAVAAAVVGVAAAAMVRTVLGRAARKGAAGTVTTEDLVGKTGNVMVPFAGTATGKVRVRVAGAAVDVLATAVDGEALGRQDEVLVVEVRDGGTAVVTKSPSAK